MFKILILPDCPAVVGHTPVLLSSQLTPTGLQFFQRIAPYNDINSAVEDSCFPPQLLFLFSSLFSVLLLLSYLRLMCVYSYYICSTLILFNKVFNVLKF